MKSNDVIYVNGDSWCDNRFFKECLFDNFQNNLVVNSAVAGNWNQQINRQTVKDIDRLSQQHDTIHCFIFYSECLRGNEEWKVLKNIKKQERIDCGINFLLEKLLEVYHYSLISKINHKCKLSISTAFIDKCSLSNMSSMLDMITNREHQSKCFSLCSYLKNKEYFKNNFSEDDNLQFMDSILNRCKDIEQIPNIKNYHPNDTKTYENVIAEIKLRTA